MGQEGLNNWMRSFDYPYTVVAAGDGAFDIKDSVGTVVAQGLSDQGVMNFAMNSTK